MGAERNRPRVVNVAGCRQAPDAEAHAPRDRRRRAASARSGPPSAAARAGARGGARPHADRHRADALRAALERPAEAHRLGGAEVDRGGRRRASCAPRCGSCRSGCARRAPGRRRRWRPSRGGATGVAAPAAPAAARSGAPRRGRRRRARRRRRGRGGRRRGRGRRRHGADGVDEDRAASCRSRRARRSGTGTCPRSGTCRLPWKSVEVAAERHRPRRRSARCADGRARPRAHVTDSPGIDGDPARGEGGVVDRARPGRPRTPGAPRRRGIRPGSRTGRRAARCALRSPSRKGSPIRRRGSAGRARPCRRARSSARGSAGPCGASRAGRRPRGDWS